MNGPTPYQLAMLMALSRKPQGQVFQGIEKSKLSPDERRAARRRHHRELVARRSATARRSS